MPTITSFTANTTLRTFLAATIFAAIFTSYVQSDGLWNTTTTYTTPITSTTHTTTTYATNNQHDSNVHSTTARPVILSALGYEDSLSSSDSDLVDTLSTNNKITSNTIVKKQTQLVATEQILTQDFVFSMHPSSYDCYLCSQRVIPLFPVYYQDSFTIMGYYTSIAITTEHFTNSRIGADFNILNIDYSYQGSPNARGRMFIQVSEPVSRICSYKIEATTNDYNSNLRSSPVTQHINTSRIKRFQALIRQLIPFDLSVPEERRHTLPANTSDIQSVVGFLTVGLQSFTQFTEAPKSSYGVRLTLTVLSSQSLDQDSYIRKDVRFCPIDPRDTHL